MQLPIVFMLINNIQWKVRDAMMKFYLSSKISNNNNKFKVFGIDWTLNIEMVITLVKY